MKEIELKEGEKIRIIGQKKGVYFVLINISGEIYSQTDYNRDKELKQEIKQDDSTKRT